MDKAYRGILIIYLLNILLWGPISFLGFTPKFFPILISSSIISIILLIFKTIQTPSKWLIYCNAICIIYLVAGNYLGLKGTFLIGKIYIPIYIISSTFIFYKRKADANFIFFFTLFLMYTLLYIISQFI